MFVAVGVTTVAIFVIAVFMIAFSDSGCAGSSNNLDVGFRRKSHLVVEFVILLDEGRAGEISAAVGLNGKYNSLSDEEGYHDGSPPCADALQAGEPGIVVPTGGLEH